MLEIKVGDVIKEFLNSYDVLVHGCNCFHLMGAGIAKTLSTRWPQILQEDKKTAYGSKYKLGGISYCEVEPGKTVVNGYTQFRTGKDLVEKAFEDAFETTKVLYGDKKICCPAVGMGIAGGDPSILIPKLQQIFAETNLTMFVLTDEMKKTLELHLRTQ